MTEPARSSTAGRSYVIPCTAPFRDAVKALAHRRHASIADLARAVMLLIGPQAVAAQEDPGEPLASERETVRLKSGALEGRDLLRKPRLQARLPQGLDAATIRKALAIALALDRGELELRVTEAGEAARQHQRLEQAAAEGERLGGMIGTLSFEPLPHGVRTRGEALYVLGFPPGSAPDLRAVRERFRQLARVHHPDSSFGDNRRMIQLNEAVALLQRRGQG